MARLLQKSNQPSTNTSSWGGLFSCCFAPQKPSSPQPEIPSIKVQPPTSTPAGSVHERDAADGHSVLSNAAYATSKKNEDSVKRSVPSRVEDESDRPGLAEQYSKPINAEAMYNSWVGKDKPKGSDIHENVTLSVLASRRSGAQTPTTPDTHPASQLSIPMDEFAEEHYSKDHQWQAQSSLSVQEPLNLPANVTIHTHIKMDYKTSDLTIKVIRVDNAPSEAQAGSQSYQVRIALLGLKKKKRWHTHIVSAPNPVFNEEALFKAITPDELAKMALRLRLYGCKKMRRHFIFAESTVALTALNLRGGEADIPFALAIKVGHESVVDSDSDSGDNLSRLQASRTSRYSLSRHSTSRSLRPPSATTATSGLPELDTARRVAEAKEATWPELLCGLAYNVTTKRLNIHVLRAVRLKVTETLLRTPKVYVSLTLVSGTGEKIASSHTHEVRLVGNTEFGERFAFDMNALNPREVTLFVRVFQKHHVHKSENLGWFAIGAKNNGEEERSHWNEMLQAQGQEITRWHVLNENVT
ncbi:synaptotagmin [Echinococcus multilocularis]|uniref:Synaptotagmin n=1 Tax=Echinococcus multilocularis TaxID=6211 RepID=A0A068Y5C2_ECHMU|nr:synaptotagmin [Echinococcus multilocularis]